MRVLVSSTVIVVHGSRINAVTENANPDVVFWIAIVHMENLVALMTSVRLVALENLVHITQTVVRTNAVMPMVLAPFIVMMVLLVGLSPSL